MLFSFLPNPSNPPKKNEKKKSISAKILTNVLHYKPSFAKSSIRLKKEMYYYIIMTKR